MIILDNGAWADTTYENYSCDLGLAEALCEMFDGFTVADMGCGSGTYVNVMRGYGIEATGYDGNPRTWVHSHCHVLDLSEPVLIGDYDWVMSLEVGEHIHKDKEDDFIANLTAFCQRGLVLSWAYPGQTGHGHVNERDPEYIVDTVTKRGLVLDKITTEMLRKSVKTLPYLAKTLHVFRKVQNA